MTDRLAKIKCTDYGDTVTRYDFAWLIAEVEQLRKLGEEMAATIGDLDRKLDDAEVQHARDLKTALANKEIRP